jgi:hypothetical protein
MTIITIDIGHARERVCPFCKVRCTVFPVKLNNGAWTQGCKPCAQRDGAKEMR